MRLQQRVALGRAPRASNRRAQLPLLVTTITALIAGLLPASVIAAPAPGRTPQAAPATGPLTTHIELKVIDMNGDSITHFRYLVNDDDAGNPRDSAPNCFPVNASHPGGNPDYPAGCGWPSVHGFTGGAGGAELHVVSGDQSDFDGSRDFDGDGTGDQGYDIQLEAGHTFLVSVLADGYKIGGAWFSAGNTGPVTVQLRGASAEDPLPLATVRLQVFYDGSTNGQFDADVEPVLAVSSGAPVAPSQAFKGHISDVVGEVTTDWFGNPLCADYYRDDEDSAAGKTLTPTVPPNKHGYGVDDNGEFVMRPGTGGYCIDDDQDGRLEPEDTDGIIEIRNVGPNRYGATVVPPTSLTDKWVQTTSLEGGLDWDVWAYEGYSGNSVEKLVQGGSAPFAEFGFVKETIPAWTSGPTLRGVVQTSLTYLPPAGGNPEVLPPNIIDGVLRNPWVSLVDLTAPTDMAVLVKRGNPDGSFAIPNVPDGSYQLTMWDANHNYLLGATNVTVDEGVPSSFRDTGPVTTYPLYRWFAPLEGYIFIDTNKNGQKDNGEPGLAGQTLVLKARDNSVVDHFSKFATTDNSGHWSMPQVYPYTHWNILEFYNDRYYTTGVTYQADNQKPPFTGPTTVLGAGVDVSVLSMDGLKARIDFGVYPYDVGENGGIVGSVVYNMTRNELDARLSATEDYEPGIPNMIVNLYKPIPCGTTDGADCSTDGRYELVTPLATTLVDDVPAGATSLHLTALQLAAVDDLLQIGADASLERHHIASIDAGTSTVTLDAALDFAHAAGEPVVELNPLTGAYARGVLANSTPTEKFKRPSGCQARDWTGAPISYPFMSPNDYSHECIEAPLMGYQIKTGPDESAGDFSMVNGNYGFGDGCFATGFDVEAGTCFADGTDPVEPTALTPGDYLVEVVSPLDALGRPKFKVSREEDINVFNGDQYTPAIPPPPCAGTMHVVDVAGIGPDGDNATINPLFAEAGGSPFEGEEMPLCDVKLVTLQDRHSTAPGFSFFTDVPLPGRLWGSVVEDLTLGTDPNGFFFGEKAGVPNAPVGIYDYDMRPIRTVQADPNGYFEVLLPSTGTFNCPLPAGPCPGMYRIIGNDPGQIDHPNPTYRAQYRSYESDWQIWPGLTSLADVALVQSSAVIEAPGTQTSLAPGCNLETDDGGDLLRPELFAVSTPFVPRETSRDVVIRGQGFGTDGTVLLDGVALPAASITTWNSNTINLTVPADVPTGPHQLAIRRSDTGLATINALTFHVLGAGYDRTPYEVGPGHTYATIQTAIQAASDDPGALVVVWPNEAGPFTPLGDYAESIVIHSPLVLQGVGPGGKRADGSFVRGSIINGQGFSTTQYEALRAIIDGLDAAGGWGGNPVVSDGQVVYVLAGANAGDGAEVFSSSPTFPPRIDGLRITGGEEFGFPAGGTNEPVQGGGIYVNGFARHLQITNNVIEGNGGAYGGAIRSGTPFLQNANNDNLRISRNRIVGNGGSILAGAIGLFAGSNGYEIDHNDICGNFSAEYGGAISHFGLSGPAVNRIHDNRIWFNGSYDEGGGIAIGGEPGAIDPPTESAGTGPVDIQANYIQANLADDDGGGIILLMTEASPINVVNNIIANNVSSDEGGGIALNNAANVRIVNNTIVRNLTTATSALSPGTPAPAGLSDGETSREPYNDPVLVNNIFWDNRAGAYDSGLNTINGIGLPGTGPINTWDMGTIPDRGPLHPTYSVLSGDANSHIELSATNRAGFANLAELYDLSVEALPWRGGARQFVFVHLVTDDAPPGQLGNYHLALPSGGSLAHDWGTDAGAPADDIDHEARTAGGVDAGADEDPAAIDDELGPIVSGLAIVPDPSNGTAPLTLTGHASDALTGLSNIITVEWFEGAGPHTALSASDGGFNTVDEDFTGEVTGPFTPGPHTISVRAQDASLNWGEAVDVTFTVDSIGPAVSGLNVNPNPTDGAGFVTIAGSADDSLSGSMPIGGAEWFHGADPGLGSGHPFAALDGLFDEPVEAIATTLTMSDFPQATTYTISVRAVDVLGNWGPVQTVEFTKNAPPPPPIDITGPQILSPRAAAASATMVRLTGIATDALRGDATIAEAEWFEGIDPGLGNGHAMAASDESFNGIVEAVKAEIPTASLAAGLHEFRMRARDANGNWGPTSAATFIYITPASVIRTISGTVFVDTFASGNTVPWSATSGIRNLAVGPGAALDSTVGLSVRLARNSTAYVQDNRPAALREYHARFLFHPHGASTGTSRQILFQGRAGSGSQLFAVEYRHAPRGSYLVRIVMRRSTGTVAGPWIAIGNRPRAIEIAWTAARSGSLKLYVDGRLKSTLRGNTRSYRLESVRLGMVNRLTKSAGRIYIDGFVSSRSTFVGS